MTVNRCFYISESTTRNAKQLNLYNRGTVIKTTASVNHLCHVSQALHNGERIVRNSYAVCLE